MEKNYKPIEYKLSAILDEKTFTIPNFQRGLVWKDGKIKNFIETLINGEPFGTILVYQQGAKTILIDGLQRITAIREFYKTPEKYLKPEIFEKKYIDEIIRLIKLADREASIKAKDLSEKVTDKNIRNQIIKSIKNNKFKSELITDDLEKYTRISPSNKNKKEICKILKQQMEIIEKKVNINKLVVYGIEYTGQQKRLPDIFFNLNTGGTRLSKEDVLASLWSDSRYQIKDDEILDKVVERCQVLSKKFDLDTNIKRPYLQANGITLFEYCYAIGKLLYDKKYKFYTFLGEGSKDGTEPIGFSIISLLLGMKENEGSKIDKVLNKAPAKFLKDMKKIIIEGFEQIYVSLEDWVVSERITRIVEEKNKEKIIENYNSFDSKYMIYHMFMAYIKMNYEIDVDNYKITKKRETSSIKTWNENYVKKLHMHYFFDYMTNYWNIHRQVSDLDKLIKNTSEIEKYAYDVSEDDWKDFFTKFKDTQIAESSKTFQPRTKLFLDYLIKFKIRRDPNLKTKYFTKKKTAKKFCIDIEHIVPKERISEKFTSLDESIERIVPVFSIGNACYLAAPYNRSKGKKTVWEDNDDNPTYEVSEEFINFVTYPAREEIQGFIDNKADVFKNKYYDFLDSRIDKLIDEFKENMI